MTTPLDSGPSNFPPPDSSTAPRAPRALKPKVADRSRLGVLWYRVVQWFFSTLLSAAYGLRATGVKNVPEAGAAMLVSNHLSHLDVLVIGILLRRPLNYVARSSLFFFPLGPFIRSCGAFPIQREGIGAQGLKETLRRLKSGGIVALFPEGTRSADGELGEMKAGIALLAAKARVPILPAAIVGTFEAWPKSRWLPSPHPIHVHFGTPIQPEEVASLSPEVLTSLIRQRILDCQATAREGLVRSSAIGDW